MKEMYLAGMWALKSKENGTALEEVVQGSVRNVSHFVVVAASELVFGEVAGRRERCLVINYSW